MYILTSIVCNKYCPLPFYINDSFDEVVKYIETLCETNFNDIYELTEPEHNVNYDVFLNEKKEFGGLLHVLNNKDVLKKLGKIDNQKYDCCDNVIYIYVYKTEGGGDLSEMWKHVSENIY